MNLTIQILTSLCCKNEWIVPIYIYHKMKRSQKWIYIYIYILYKLFKYQHDHVALQLKQIDMFQSIEQLLLWMLSLRATRCV